MKKLLMLFLLVTLGVALTGCSMFGGDDEYVPNRYKIEDACQGEGNYIVVDGQCVLIDDVVNQRITINGTETIVDYLDSVEQMSDFVADLSGSTGLAVVSRDILEAQTNAGGATKNDLIMLAAETEEENTTENLIVKLTEEGFFEEVSFSDDAGNEVNVTSNPLALEVFGDYTIVIFEVDLGYQDPMQDFTSKIWDSLYAGGIYLIHNDSGKMFATKDVVYTENTYTYTEDHSRNVMLTVTLGEPVMEPVHKLVLDENGNPTYDENGMEVYEEILEPVLDENGDPLVFNEGPIETVIEEVPLVEYYEQEVLNENGEVVLDDNGNPVMEIVEEPVLDENGNPIIEQREVPVVDENGDVVYQQEFQVELWIEDVVEITKTEYYATVTDTPLSELAQRFVDQVIAEYYNWNYYRVNNYVISHWGFATSDNYIYYVQNKENETDPSKYERFVMRMSFDSVNNELLLEEYINATKAGFDECEIIIDPRNDNIICDSWDSNIKIYSSVNGLATIPDSDQLQPVTFPNGELYFYDSQQTYVEELDYYTTMLYTIESDGSLTSHYIELGERENLCYDNCYNWVQVDMYDIDGNPYGEDWWNNIDLQMNQGDKLIANADLELTSVGSFDATRPACTNANGCWYYTQFELYDGETLIGTFEGGKEIFPGEAVPPYKAIYDVNVNTVYQYEQLWDDADKVCDNYEAGCVDYMYLIDPSINTNGLWIYDKQIIDGDDTYIDRITINDVNNAVYEYSKDVSGEVCEYDTCEEYIPIYIYDSEGEQLYHSSVYQEISLGDTIPLHIDYQITDNTTVTYEESVCTTSSGCWGYYNINNAIYYSIYYEQGDQMYDTIDFAASDKTVVTFETLQNEMCLDENGCWNNEPVIYTLEDSLGEVIFEFEEWLWIDYGETLPFSVTLQETDVTISYQKETTQDTAICEDTTCYQDVSLAIQGSSEWDYEYLGWGNMTFSQGDQLVTMVILEETATPTSVINDNLCNNVDGCFINTENFTILDELGNEMPRVTEEGWYSSLPVMFAYGEPIPSWDNNEFEATFTMTNVLYQTSRLNVYDFIWNLNNVIILDDNLYLIERDSWAQGQDNVILTFNETTNNYQAMYTNLSAVTEITKLGEGSYIAINDDETAIHKFDLDTSNSSSDYYYFTVTNMTEGLLINGVNDLIVDYDGSIFFKGVDNFIQDITGTIQEDGTVTLDTEYTEREVVRLRPIN